MVTFLFSFVIAVVAATALAAVISEISILFGRWRAYRMHKLHQKAMRAVIESCADDNYFPGGADYRPTRPNNKYTCRKDREISDAE